MNVDESVDREAENEVWTVVVFRWLIPIKLIRSLLENGVGQHVGLHSGVDHQRVERS